MQGILRSTLWLGFFGAILAAWWLMYVMAMDMDLDLLGRPGEMGGPAGDALIEIKVRPHKQFERDGDDIRVDLPISIDEAVLGGKVEVPTISGPVNLTIPKGTSSGQTFRLRNKGVRNATTGETGDQFVSVKIVLPDEIDDGLAYYLTEWRQTNRYNPRR